MSNSVQLSHLGSNKWEKERKKALKKAYDTASDLLDLYSKKAIKSGVSYPTQISYDSFCSEFPLLAYA